MRALLLTLGLAGCGFGGGDFLPEFDFFTVVALVDLDGDGLPDEISVWMHVDNIEGNAGTLGIRRQTAPGRFGAREEYGVGAEPLAAVAADVDDDGRVDLVVAARYSNRIDVLRQEADGRFTLLAVPTGREPRTVAVADVDGDGRVDLVVGGLGPTLHLQPPDGSFGAEPIAGDRFVAVDADGTPEFGKVPLVFVDLDRNGIEELVTAPADGGITVRWNGGAPIPHSGPLNASALVAGDLDGDEWPDLVVGADLGGLVVIRNDAGVLRPPEAYAGTESVVSIAIGDLDGDGRPDLLYANLEAIVRLHQDPAGAFFSQ